MATARRPALIYYVLDSYVDMSPLTGDPGERWSEVVCDSKKKAAYGCGENIQEAVKGLKLYVRLGDDPRVINSSLAIRMTEDALSRFESELEVGLPRVDPGFRTRTTAEGHIVMRAAEDLLVIMLSFHRELYGDMSYQLVYDHKHASLSMTTYLPNSHQVDAVLRPVAKRTCDGDYELFVMASECEGAMPFSFDQEDTEPAPLLGVFSPATTANPAWEVRTVRSSVPVSVEQRFKTDVTFSFQGKGFWVDLSQGILYCDLMKHCTAGDSVMDFSYIELPREYVLGLEDALDCDVAMEASRTVGCCDRDSIWFVCIDEGVTDHYADDMVTMWTLKLPDRQWKKDVEFPLRELWTGEFLEPYAEICSVNQICSLDVRSKRLLWHGTVHNLPFSEPLLVPSYFFQMKHGTRKRKFDGQHPATGRTARE